MKEKETEVLFDKDGRRIPLEDLNGWIEKTLDERYAIEQPIIPVSGNRIRQLEDCLGVSIEITPKQFCQQVERLLSLIRDDSRIADILNGVHLPVILPQLTVEIEGDSLLMNGIKIHKQYIRGIEKSYVGYSNRKFYNAYEKRDYSIGDASRSHEQLIQQMKEKSVIGIHFPDCLRGFTVEASHEQMSTLPETFILSGVDTLIAMIMYPDILCRTWTPQLILSGLSNGDPLSMSPPSFIPDDEYLQYHPFDKSLDLAYGSSSSGLLFIGEIPHLDT